MTDRNKLPPWGLDGIVPDLPFDWEREIGQRPPVPTVYPAGGAGGEAVKADDGKVRYDLLPPELLEGVAVVLTFGARKYSARNWEKGMAWGRVFGALMRHLWAWWRGEAKDPETGYSHLWHAGCCLAFLIAFEQRGIGTDDRPKQ